MTVYICVAVEASPGFTEREAEYEVLFNFGVGNDDEQGLGWPNMYGQAYHITNVLTPSEELVVRNYPKPDTF